MDVQTREYDTLLADIEKKVKELGGYIESLSTGGRSYYDNTEMNRYGDMTLRIPQQKLDEFVDAVSGMANVTHRSENVQDVTLQYVDLESHKKTLEVEQERLLALLEKAETMEDIIRLEQRISEVRYQLENMASSLRMYDNKIDFSTIYLTVNEVKKLTPVEEETAWEKIQRGFTDRLENIAEGFKTFGIALAIHIPDLLVWAVFITIVVVMIKLCIAKGRKKKALKQPEEQKQETEKETEKETEHEQSV